MAKARWRRVAGFTEMQIFPTAPSFLLFKRVKINRIIN